MLKRLFDVSLSLVLLLLLSPIMLMVAILVKYKLGSPIIFRQDRPGLNSIPFGMLKFRSMTSAKDEHGNLLPDSLRMTNFGRFLRKTSLDELPELINILKGDMSFVGPRPLLMQYLPYYTEEEMHRHDVRPGLTGLAQISGRNALTWEAKLSLDIEYVKTRNFCLDLLILCKTAKKVILSDGVLEAAPQGALDVYRKNKSHLDES